MKAEASSFLEDSKSLACIHCGLCLSSCPTYLETGDENDSPRGRIYLMRSIQKQGGAISPAAVRHIDRCLGCRACEVACPSGVQYGALLESARDYIEPRIKRSLSQRLLRRFLIEKIFPSVPLTRLAVFPAKLIKRFGLERFAPSGMRPLLDLMPADAGSVSLPELVTTAQTPSRGRAGFITGCVMQVLFGKTHQSSVNLLSGAGFDVVIPREQVCCGALHAHTGDLERSRELARRNIEIFERSGVDTIVINAAGCGSTLKEYGHMLEHDPVWRERAAAFAAKVKDLSEVLGDRKVVVQPCTGGSCGKVTYHDACHLAHAQGVRTPPRELVRGRAGDSFTELPEADVCCGSAGSYNLTEPELAGQLQSRKVRNILATGAKVVVTTNPGCILQIRAGLDKAGAKDVQVVHLADYLDTGRGG